MRKSVSYDKIVQNSPNGTISTDENYIIRIYNASAERLLGIEKCAAVGKCFFDVISQMKPFREKLSEETLNRIVIGDKNLCVRNVTIRETDDEGNKQLSHFFFVHDYDIDLALATEVKHSEKLLAELQEILDGSFDGILVTDADANVLYVNESYVRNTGIQKVELIGHNMRELVNPQWMKTSIVLLVIEQKKTLSMHHTTRNGKNIMVTGTPILDDQGNLKRVVVNTRDISEIYNLREELSRAAEVEKVYLQQIKGKEDKFADKKQEIVVANPKMREIFALAKKVANFNTTILISGESGVGKEVIATYVHNQNAVRRQAHFISVNCGAIPENLLESELFGYEEGAFSGAVKGGKSGLIEAAHNGTLFLDEISEMSSGLQVKLLRTLETQTIRRLGSQDSIFVDFRVVAAANKDLKAMVKEGTFREDLYYRLNVVRLDVPPLRERQEDIGMLALRYLMVFNEQYGMEKKITYEVLREMESYFWPGNVRELKNAIENMVVVSNNEYLQLDDLPWIEMVDGNHEGISGGKEAGTLSLKEQMEAFERKILVDAKKKYGSSRKIAKALQVNSSTIVRKLSKIEN